eukprot:scaffold2149_cov187-Cylindrotheca_fusiformis.AAC.13
MDLTSGFHPTSLKTPILSLPVSKRGCNDPIHSRCAWCCSNDCRPGSSSVSSIILRPPLMYVLVERR